MSSEEQMQKEFSIILDEVLGMYNIPEEEKENFYEVIRGIFRAVIKLYCQRKDVVGNLGSMMEDYKNKLDEIVENSLSLSEVEDEEGQS